MRAKQQTKDKKLERSRSRSPQGKSGKAQLKTSKEKGRKAQRLNPSLKKSQSKRSINGKSEKKLRKNLSQPKLGNSGLHKSQSGLKNESKVNASKIIALPGKAKEKTDAKEPKENPLKSRKQPIEKKEEERGDERDMGIIYMKPQHDKVQMRGLESTDEVFEKYLEMIKNDNDSGYVLNAFSELRSLKREEEPSGPISRTSHMFQGLEIDKIITACKRVPAYYTGSCGKAIQSMRLTLLTKFKVEVDVGLMQYSVDGDRLTIFRLYISKIYRRMNYLCFIMLEVLRSLIAKHSGVDRMSVFVLDKNVPVQKFFKYMGCKIDKIATDSSNKSVDYFQEFFMKKKDLQTALASFK